MDKKERLKFILIDIVEKVNANFLKNKYWKKETKRFITVQDSYYKLILILMRLVQISINFNDNISNLYEFADKEMDALNMLHLFNNLPFGDNIGNYGRKWIDIDENKGILINCKMENIVKSLGAEKYAEMVKWKPYNREETEKLWETKVLSDLIEFAWTANTFKDISEQKKQKTHLRLGN